MKISRRLLMALVMVMVTNNFPLIPITDNGKGGIGEHGEIRQGEAENDSNDQSQARRPFCHQAKGETGKRQQIGRKVSGQYMVRSSRVSAMSGFVRSVPDQVWPGHY